MNVNTIRIRWYKSKVDWWLIPLLAIGPMAPMVVCVIALRNGDPVEMAWGFCSLLFVIALYLGVVFPMRYGIGEGYLTIRCGLFRQRIDLDKIVEVRPTRNPLSSPALSLDRLQVRYGDGFFKSVMISPATRGQFLDDLQKSARLEFEDGHWRRRQ